MKACLDQPWNVLANVDPGEANWANHPLVNRNDYRNGDNTEYDQPDSWRDLFRELYNTIWWNPSGSRMAETSSHDEGYNKDWDLERQYPGRDK